MRLSKPEPWIDKMFVRIARERKRPERHEPLKARLSLNRGKALGMPYEFPRTAYQDRLRADRNRRWVARLLAECPF